MLPRISCTQLEMQVFRFRIFAFTPLLFIDELFILLCNGILYYIVLTSLERCAPMTGQYLVQHN